MSLVPSRRKRYGMKRKKPFGRKYYRNRMALRGVNPLMNIQPFRLIFHDSLTDTELTAFQTNEYALNAINACDLSRSPIGGQPRGHDQLALFYTHYRVMSTLVEVDAVNLTNLQHVTLAIGVAGQNVTSPVDEVSVYEDGRYKTRSMTIQQPFKFKRFFKNWVVADVPYKTYKSDSAYTHTMNNAPPALNRLIMAFWSVSGTACSVKIHTRITYYGYAYGNATLPEDT